MEVASGREEEIEAYMQYMRYTKDFLETSKFPWKRIVLNFSEFVYYFALSFDANFTTSQEWYPKFMITPLK